MELLALYAFMLYIATAVFTGEVAGRKGYSSGWWLIGGILFGPVALLAAVGMPDEHERRRQARPDS